MPAGGGEGGNPGSAQGRAVRVLRSIYVTPMMDSRLRDLAFKARVTKSELVRTALSAKLAAWQADRDLLKADVARHADGSEMVLRSVYLTQEVDEILRQVAYLENLSKNDLMRGAIVAKLPEWSEDLGALARDIEAFRPPSSPVPPERDPSIAQFRSARALLNWSQDELAARAEVGRATVGDFERGARQPIRLSLKAMRSTLEAAGIEFLWTEDGGEGVLLKRIAAGEEL